MIMLLAIAMVLPIVSCADVDDNDDPTPPSETTDNTKDGIPKLDFGEETFSILTYDASGNYDTIHCIDELTTDNVSNSKYNMMQRLSERFNVTFEETVQTQDYVNLTYRGLLDSGDDSFDIVFANARFAHYYAEEGKLYTYDDLEYINLDKDYWDQNLLNYTSIGKRIYYAYGAYDTSSYDLTHCLAFNKKLFDEYKLDDPYQLVKDGKWTFDRFHEMILVAKKDNNHNDVWDKEDSYGYVALGKQILPNFWIAGGTTTVKYDRDMLPYPSIVDNEPLYDIMESCFKMFYDDQTWFVETSIGGNQSANQTNIFLADRALFDDTTFFFLNQLRDMESEFGILPYPKFTEDQINYYSRVEGGCIAVVPITISDPKRSGAIIEAMASDGYNDLMHEYYDAALKRRTARDEESSKMLDIIFNSRVYDLGDTWYCDQIRDGIMATLWNNNDRTLVSTYKKYEKIINSTINETIRAYLK